MYDIFHLRYLKTVENKVYHSFILSRVSTFYVDFGHSAFKGFGEYPAYFVGFFCDYHSAFCSVEAVNDKVNGFNLGVDDYLTKRLNIP